jgi:hypothetical protein
MICRTARGETPNFEPAAISPFSIADNQRAFFSGSGLHVKVTEPGWSRFLFEERANCKPRYKGKGDAPALGIFGMFLVNKCEPLNSVQCLKTARKRRHTTENFEKNLFDKSPSSVMKRTLSYHRHMKIVEPAERNRMYGGGELLFRMDAVTSKPISASATMINKYPMAWAKKGLQDQPIGILVQ